MGPTNRHETATGVHLIELFAIVRRHLRSILMVTVIGTVLAALAATLIPSKYTAKAQIIVEPQPTTRFGSSPARISPVDKMAVDTQVTMLTAREFLRTVLTSLKEPGPTSEPTPDGTKTAQQETKPHQPIDAAIRRHLAATKFEYFVRHLSVIQELGSRVISVRYTSSSPSEAALVANQTVRLYLENVKKIRGNYLRGQIEGLSDRIAQIQTAVATPLTPDDSGPGSTIESAEVNTQVLVVLQRRRQEIRDLLETIGPGASILSTAVPPEKPSSLSPFLFILPAAALFFFLSSLLAIAREQTDQSLRSERDINNALGVPCIGHVPAIPLADDLPAHSYLLQEPSSPYSESIRSIVSHLQWAPGARESKVIMLTSSVQNEGKTTLAVSLAAYASSLKKRVLLIDLDFSNPTLMHELDAPAGPGITDLVLADVPLGKAIRRHKTLGLDYLSSENERLDPLPLFADGGLEQVLSELSKRYDLIIVDGPQILGSTGAQLLAALVDKVLFVVKWGATRRDLAQNAIKDLRESASSTRKSAESTSAIVTQVDLAKHAAYRFGDTAEILARN